MGPQPPDPSASRDPERFTVFTPALVVDAFRRLGGQFRSGALLERLVETAYQTGLYTEESRRLRLSLIVSEEERSSSPTRLELHRGLPATPEVVRKLAGTIHPGRTALQVVVRGGQPLIVGFADLESFGTGLLLPDTRIEIVAPGVVELEQGLTLVRFQRDRLVVPASPVDLLRLFSGSGAEQMVREVVGSGPDDYRSVRWAGAELGRLEPDRFRKHWPALAAEATGQARWLLARCLHTMIGEARSAGTGGAFLLLGGKSRGGLFRAINRGYRVDRSSDLQQRWDAALSVAHRWRVHGRMAFLGKQVLDEELINSDPARWIVNVASPHMSEQLRRLDRDACSIGRLAAVDGAVVLDEVLHPLAFGVKFDVNLSRLPRGTTERLASRGMRHRSMVAAVSQSDGSRGVVISQDGDVTLVRPEPTGGARLEEMDRGIAEIVEMREERRRTWHQLAGWFIEALVRDHGA